MKWTAVQRTARAGKWLDRIQTEADRKAAMDGCRYDHARYVNIAEFFVEALRLIEGRWRGEPFELMPWQHEVLRQVFGWVRPDGRRRFRKVYCSVAKKNGKSPFAAGIGLYLLISDDGAPKVASVATERDQARIVHSTAVEMVKASPELLRIIKLNESTHQLSRPDVSAWYRAFSADADSREGYNLTAAIADELHVWKGHKLHDALRYAFATRREPLFVEITTAGTYDTTSIGWEEYTAAKSVLSGESDNTELYAFIREPDEGDDWREESTWRKCNPAWGYTIDPDEVRAAAAEAVSTSRLENTFRRYRLNEWTQQTTRWLQMHVWNGCCAPPELTADDRCFIGVDLSSVDDLTAVVVAAKRGDTYCIEPHFWCPEETIVRVAGNPNGDLYRQWAASKHLTPTPGPTVDYGFIRQRIIELCDRYSVGRVGFDPWQAQHLAGELHDRGIEAVFFRQGFASLNAPSKELERAYLAGKLRHGGNPVLTWCASNAAARYDETGQSMRPVKADRHSKLKIDGITASVIAIGLLLLDEGGSVYESGKRPDGLLML